MHLFHMSSDGALVSVTPAYWGLLFASWIVGVILVGASSFVLEHKLSM